MKIRKSLTFTCFLLAIVVIAWSSGQGVADSLSSSKPVATESGQKIEVSQGIRNYIGR